MSNKKQLQKLELTWIGKGEEPKLEPRILIENPEYSYGDPNSPNMLIHGDNLLALKALEQDYAGKVKCIYIDPPYNTGNAFEHYDDGVEHSLWLSLMKPRLDILRNLLSNDGSIWISIDDNEAHYLKVMCDGIFGRQNFIASVIWHKKHTRSNDAKFFSDNHDFVIVYCKNRDKFQLNLLPRTEEQNKGYKNLDNDPRGPWASQPIQVKTPSDAYIYEIQSPNGNKFWPPKGRSWQFGLKRYEELVEDNRIWFGADGNNVPRIKKFLTEVQDGITPLTIWWRDEVGDNQQAKKEVKDLFPDDPFGTPKPERLLERVLMLGSNEGDLVLDSFLGSGTTAAVAHKMGRRYIGVELGEHAKTHCFPRLKQVVDGEQGGISKAVNWQGGGGFKFYTLAPSLLKQDKFGNWVISQEYNADMLAAAMAKQEGFKYQPHESTYWKQGQSSEQDFIFTTTQFLTVEALDSIKDEMQPGETLLICCKSFQKECKGKFGNITIKKIPLMLLGRCEYGKEDYSLNIINIPVDASNEDAEDSIEEISVQAIRDKNKSDDQTSLF
ncbi:site-specific DNA-methyltransferase [Flavobacterium aurantiibacter]|uniref:site-specific DNA-methyltransferase (adenine-specific) n=1 Tax=Flavobacterium aurantiibacter TaxID=2023067 RepID=A0A255ZVC0_9FLAO|nr:site-specific DNA-methyltransferase [Flavobacterium aurantiibacter]OYQ45477.1 site-specific DNA-methyltransferase [Flavobacterium aurantiibacter]